MSKEKTGAVMVVGGGITGMQAALDLANAGYYVYLVEKSGSIGGIMSQLDGISMTSRWKLSLLLCWALEIRIQRILKAIMAVGTSHMALGKKEHPAHQARRARILGLT